MKRIVIAGLGVSMVLAAVAPSGKESERLGYRTYREKVGGVTVLADTTIAAQDPASAYVPIAVAVRLALGTPNATVTRESFTLIDAGGNRVSASGAMEIRERHKKVAFDASRMRAQGMAIGQQFSGDIQVESRFYGDTTGVGLVQDRVNLSPSTWFMDIMYFPRPPAGLEGIVTLRLEGGGLEAPIEVRFPVIEEATPR